jgi:hypothetical protein
MSHPHEESCAHCEYRVSIGQEPLRPLTLSEQDLCDVLEALKPRSSEKMRDAVIYRLETMISEGAGHQHRQSMLEIIGGQLKSAKTSFFRNH